MRAPARRWAPAEGESPGRKRSHEPEVQPRAESAASGRKRSPRPEAQPRTQRDLNSPPEFPRGQRAPRGSRQNWDRREASRSPTCPGAPGQCGPGAVGSYSGTAGPRAGDPAPPCGISPGPWEGQGVGEQGLAGSTAHGAAPPPPGGAGQGISAGAHTWEPAQQAPSPGDQLQGWGRASLPAEQCWKAPGLRENRTYN